ncbi:MAG TPA: Ig-like domain-containing protein [Longimicrobium sp.]
MRKLLLCSAFALLAAGCKDGGSTPPVATSVSVSPGTVSLSAIGATRVVRAAVVDQKGNAMPGAPVTWSSNSTAALIASTGADSAVVVAMGNGSASITATSGSASGAVTVQVSQVPTKVQKAAGDGQTAARSSAVPSAPRVLVVDALDNPVPGVSVQFAVTSGGGSVTGATQTTDANGTAAVASWLMGATLGANTLTATVAGVAPVEFTATAADAATIVIQTGHNQAAMAGTAVPTAPVVVVRDASGNPMAGMPVTFSVTAGGGSVGTATVTTNAAGVASPGSWTLGPEAGPNTLRASVSGITGAPATFRGTGCSGGGGAGYAMTLCFTSSMTAGQRAAFQSAATRWAGIITADLPDIPGSIPTDACGDGSPSMSHNFDDLLIFAGVEAIDGPSGILGQAGWCYRRTAGLPVIGVMRFDMADMNSLEAGGGLNSVILHEMGHVLGIGTLWAPMGLLQNPSTASSTQDTHFTGAQAIIGFDAIGGTAYAGGQKVPVENTGGPGTANGHWRESVLGRELMTGFLNNGTNPLSVLTVRSLTDLGYTVDVSTAEAFTITFALQNADAATSRLRMVNDLYTGPRFTIDRLGRRTRLGN